VVLAPPLPPIVVLGAEPYYAQNGYHYHYRNDGWSYSRSKRGPWLDLPRDRYPREVRHKDDGPKKGSSGRKDGDGKKDGGGKNDGDSRKDGGRDAGRKGK
jgi:hypothetical protein